MSGRYIYIQYGVDQYNKYYIMDRSKQLFDTPTEATEAASRNHLDIPCCHGGPYLLVMEARVNKDATEHQKAIAKMLSDDARGCQVQ